MEAIEKLPQNIKRLVNKLETKRIPFNELTESNAEKAANYVKTKTLMDLLKSPQIDERNIMKGDEPIILVFCQPSEEINIQKGEIFPYTPISYPSWLLAAGAQCIPFPYNINEGSMHFLL